MLINLQCLLARFEHLLLANHSLEKTWHSSSIRWHSASTARTNTSKCFLLFSETLLRQYIWMAEAEDAKDHAIKFIGFTNQQKQHKTKPSPQKKNKTITVRYCNDHGWTWVAQLKLQSQINAKDALHLLHSQQATGAVKSKAFAWHIWWSFVQHIEICAAAFAP